ncbi:MAG: bacterial Ig-like domain-containing protein [Christensenellales bacterium]
MKKILSTILTVCCVVCFIIALTGCNNDTRVPPEGGSGEVQSPPENNGDIVPSEDFCVRFFSEGRLYDERTAKGIVAPPDEPVRIGYIFTGWYLADGNPFNFSVSVACDTDLYAGWEVAVKSVQVAQNSSHRTVFNREEMFSYDGLKIEAVFYDDSRVEITEYSVDSSSYKAERSGRYEITVKTEYGDLGYYVIVEGTIGLRISNNGEYRTVYADGEEIDASGVTVYKIFADGSEQAANIGELVFLSGNAGNKYVKGIDGKDTVCIKLSFDDVATSYEVSVYDVNKLPPTEMFVKTYPSVTDFVLGSQFSYDGLVVEKTTDIFGDRRFVMNENEYEVDFSACDINATGEYFVKIISIADGGIYVEYAVNVVETKGELTGIIVSSLPFITTFYRMEEIDLSGLTVKKEYSDGVKVGLNEGEYTVDYSAYDAKTPDDYTIKVSLKERPELFASFVVKVVSNPMEGEFYAKEGSACGYSFKIYFDAVSEALVAVDFDYENNDWQATSDTIDASALNSFERSNGEITVAEDTVFYENGNYFGITTADGESEMKYEKITSETVLLFIDDMDGWFIAVEKGSRISEETLIEISEAGGKIYKSYDYGTEEGVEISADDVFYENATVYVIF